VAHNIFFFAVVCCGCSLVSVETGLEFATQNEDQNWVYEQAFVQLSRLPLMDTDPSSALALAFWRDIVLRPVGRNLICEMLVNQLTSERWHIDENFRIAVLNDSSSVSLRELAQERILCRYRDSSANDQRRGLQLLIDAMMQMPNPERVCDYWPWNPIMYSIRYASCIMLVHPLTYSQRGIFSRNARSRANKAHLLGANTNQRYQQCATLGQISS
jgi:hypothetical protein